VVIVCHDGLIHACLRRVSLRVDVSGASAPRRFHLGTAASLGGGRCSRRAPPPGAPSGARRARRPRAAGSSGGRWGAPSRPVSVRWRSVGDGRPDQAPPGGDGDGLES